jgi:predicted nucleotidyltransferase
MAPKTLTTKALKQLAEKYRLEVIYAFGSRSKEALAHVKGELDEIGPRESDLDIGVMPEEGSGLSAQLKARLTMNLEDLFGVNRVDVVVLTEVETFLALDIVRGELLYCKDADKQAEYELYILRKAGDLAHYERQKRQMALSPEK